MTKHLVLLFTLCSVLLYAQKNNIQELNNTKAILEQSDDYKHEKILESVTNIAHLSNDVESILNDYKSDITTRFNYISNAEAQQRSISTLEARKGRVGKIIIVSGIVKNIESTDDSQTYVVLGNNVKCSLSKKDLRKVNLGSKVFVKGKVKESTNQHTILVNSSLFKKRNLSAKYNDANNLLDTFVEKTLIAIDKQLSKENDLASQSTFENANKEFKLSHFSKALVLYQNVYKINSEFPKIHESILETQNNINYFKAKKEISYNLTETAYLLLEELAFKYNFKDSKTLFESAYIKNYEKKIKRSELENNLTKYISVFDTLNKKTLRYKATFFDSLYADWIQEFEKFAYDYYINNYSSYYVVPGGNYKKYYGEIIEINTFIINPNEIDQTLLHSYNLTHANKISQNTDKEYMKVAKWLGLSLLTQREIDYIKCGGWKSDEERVYYTDENPFYIASKKIKLDVNKYLFLSLDDLNDESLKGKYETKAVEIDEIFNKSIVLQKELAYLSKRVEKIYKNNVTPSLGYFWGWENYSDFEIPEFSDSSLVIEHSGVGGGLSFGTVIKSGKSEYAHMLNLFANYYYATEAVFADSLIRKQYSVKDYKFSSIEFGVGYSRMLRGNDFLNLGYSVSVGFAISNKQFKITDNSAGELLSYSAQNNSIFIEAGLHCLFNIKLKGYYPLKRNNFGNNIRGEVLIELAYPIWFNLADPFY